MLPVARRKPSARFSDEEIEAKILENRMLKAARDAYRCPACGNLLVGAANLLRHMHICCADIMDEAAWQQVGRCFWGSRLLAPGAPPPGVLLEGQGAQPPGQGRPAMLPMSLCIATHA